MPPIHRTGCLVCGTGLAYEIDYKESVCYICQKARLSNVGCKKGRFAPTKEGAVCACVNQRLAR